MRTLSKKKQHFNIKQMFSVVNTRSQPWLTLILAATDRWSSTKPCFIEVCHKNIITFCCSPKLRDLSSPRQPSAIRQKYHIGLILCQTGKIHSDISFTLPLIFTGAGSKRTK